MIDLHSHTVHSDGTYTVKELLEEAQRLGLTFLSITDHNSVDAYDELMDPSIRKLFNGIILPGVEITTSYKGEIVEVLGYIFDVDTMKQFLKDNIKTFREYKLGEYELIKNKYRSIGVKFNEISFNPDEEPCWRWLLPEINKYSWNKKFFLDEKNMEEPLLFFRNEIGNHNSPLYVDLSSLNPSLELAIDMIHKAGGIVSFAHTFQYSDNVVKDLETILDNYPIDALECFYSTFSDEQSKYLQDICKRRGLFMTGGSDTHGTRKKNHDLGVGAGNLQISEDVITNWVNLYLPDYGRKM